MFIHELFCGLRLAQSTKVSFQWEIDEDNVSRLHTDGLCVLYVIWSHACMCEVFKDCPLLEKQKMLSYFSCSWWNYLKDFLVACAL